MEIDTEQGARSETKPILEQIIEAAATDSAPNGNQGKLQSLYTPSEDDFVPESSHIGSTDSDSLEYWEGILSQCVPETRLNTPAPGRRDTFALGGVIIKCDYPNSETTGDYSFWDENEESAVLQASGALPHLTFPRYYLRTKIRGRDILVRSRIRGISLNAAWPNLTATQKAGFKIQTREIVRRLHLLKPSAEGPSYVLGNGLLEGDTKVGKEERELLFGTTTAESDLGLSHNNLVPSNIIVENDEIIGIIGWSNAGYFSLESSGKVHSKFRCKDGKGNMIDDLWEENASWHDIYDISHIGDGRSNDDEMKDIKRDIKSEESIPSLNTLPQAVATEALDFPTPKKITDLKQESVSRASPASERSSPAPSIKAPKKRPAPAGNKKGQATRKPAAKKRKLNDTESVDGTVGSQRSSATPSVRAKAPPKKGRKQTSTSIASSPVPGGKSRGKSLEGEDDMDDDDDDTVFCICRKPDNHTWMIACDGGCEDWFHGKCVNIKQIDADLIDKYICPNCQAKNGTHSTWKRMCRLLGCRQPARVMGKSPSKYCSDDHGVEFMRRKILDSTRSSSYSRENTIPAPNPAFTRGHSTPNKFRPRDRENESVDRKTLNSNEDEVDNDNDQEMFDVAGVEKEDVDDLVNRGGVLTPREIKAVANGVSSVEEFRKLGESIFSSETAGLKALREVALSFDAKSDNPSQAIDFDQLQSDENIEWMPEERRQMGILQERRAELLHRSQMLKDRDKFVTLVRQRAKTILEKLRQTDAKGWKDICGFDVRLSWSDEEFDEWRQTETGKKALESGVLEAEPQPKAEDVKDESPAKDTEMVDADQANEEEIIAQGVCIKKRCEQHKQWVKVQQQDILFEQSIVKDRMAKCEKTATDVLEGVVLRVYGDQYQLQDCKT